MNNDIENPNSEYWKQKYLKYKAKYMNLNKTGGRHRNYNPYFNQPIMPPMPLLVTSSEIGDTKEEDSIILPLTGPGQFLSQFPSQLTGLYPGQYPGRYRGQYPGLYPGLYPGQYPGLYQVLEPKKKDPLYEMYSSFIKKEPVIYFRIIKGGDILLKKTDSIIEKKLSQTDTKYSEIIKKELDDYLSSSTSIETVQNKDNHSMVKGKFVFVLKITDVSVTAKEDFEFKPTSGLSDDLKSKLL
jgi:hypothetical protein